MCTLAHVLEDAGLATIVLASVEAVAEQMHPPRFDPDVHPAVDEAQGLRKAYDRSIASRGVTSVGRVLGPDDVGDTLLKLDRIANGLSWKEAELPGTTIACVHDIRTYYEEAALELVDGPPPAGRAAEAWFYEKTEAGNTIMAARQAMRDAEAPSPSGSTWPPATAPDTLSPFGPQGSSARRTDAIA